MSRAPALERVFAQHAQRRAAGLPTPSVLVGASVTDEWTASMSAAPVARSTSTTADDVARDYLEAAIVRVALEQRLSARVAAARAVSGASNERTPFEREVWLDVSRDALLAASDVDGQLLLGFAFAGEPTPSPLRAFAAAVRVLADVSAPLLLVPTGGGLDAALRAAIALTEAAPKAHVAVTTTADAWRNWLASTGREHAKAVLRPHAIALPSSPEGATPTLLQRAQQTGTVEDDEAARSAAERMLFDALDASDASRGLFALNQCLDVSFGGRPLEIDLACASHRLAVEVDGYFHFRDADAYRRDRRKDILLQKEGYFVVRALAEDVVTRIDDVVAIIHETIAFLSDRRESETGR